LIGAVFDLAQTVHQMGRNRAIGADIHQLAEQLLWILFSFNPVTPLALGRIGGGGGPGHGRRQSLRQLATQGLQAFPAAGIEAHDRR
jgi:hypothetical protein